MAQAPVAVLSPRSSPVGTGARVKPGGLPPSQKRRRCFPLSPVPLPGKQQRRVEEILRAGDFVRRRALRAGRAGCSRRGDNMAEDRPERGP